MRITGTKAWPMPGMHTSRVCSRPHVRGFTTGRSGLRSAAEDAGPTASEPSAQRPAAGAASVESGFQGSHIADGQGTTWSRFEDRYSSTTKAVGVLLRKKLYKNVEVGIQFFNEKSGWTQVEHLKNAITSLEDGLRAQQDAFKHVRAELDEANSTHRTVQNEISTLAAAKHSWTDVQFKQYQDLLQQERALQQKLVQLQHRSRNAEDGVDLALRDLMEGLRKRFHEEQLWTDRIRQLSMWSTIGILFANSLIFLFTYALRSREKAIITANLAAIRDDMQRHQESLAGLLASQERLGEMHGHLTEATSKASDLRAGNGGVAAGLAPFIAKPDSQSEKLEPDPSTTAGHSEGTLVADSVQATASQQQRRKTMLAWYVGVACLCSWALGRCMPNTG